MWEDSLTVQGNEAFYNYQVYNQAIAVPETVDAIRALTGIESAPSWKTFASKARVAA